MFDNFVEGSYSYFSSLQMQYNYVCDLTLTTVKTRASPSTCNEVLHFASGNWYDGDFSTIRFLLLRNAFVLDIDNKQYSSKLKLIGIT